jgi:hypothetical protein
MTLTEFKRRYILVLRASQSYAHIFRLNYSPYIQFQPHIDGSSALWTRRGIDRKRNNNKAGLIECFDFIGDA